MQKIIFSLLLMVATGVNATTLTYVLDQSNRLADGVDYVSVTLSDDTTPGLLSVSVDLLAALDGYRGEHTGIQAFAFNLHEDVRIGSSHNSANQRPRRALDKHVVVLPNHYILRIVLTAKDGRRAENYRRCNYAEYQSVH